MAVPVAVVFIAVFIAGVCGNTCESDASLSSVEILSDLVDARINAIFAAKVAESTAAVEQRFNATVDERISTVSATLSALNATLDERITTISTTVDAQNVTISELLSQPEIGTVHVFPYQTTSSPFNFRIHRLSTSLQIVLPHTNSLVISDRSSSYTTSVLAYRPNFANDTTAVFFINLEAIFPCYRTISNDNQIPPVCQLFSYSDMSPPSGRPYIEASDIGNNFHIFSGSQNKATYGFGIMGYSQVVGAGWNYRVELTLVCLLPPACSLN